MEERDERVEMGAILPPCKGYHHEKKDRLNVSASILTVGNSHEHIVSAIFGTLESLT